MNFKFSQKRFSREYCGAIDSWVSWFGSCGSPHKSTNHLPRFHQLKRITVDNHSEAVCSLPPARINQIDASIVVRTSQLNVLNITGRAGWTARVVSLTAASGGPASVLPAGPAAGENEIRQSNEHNFQQKTIPRR